MSRKWFYRLLVSYLPAFVCFVSVLLLIGFFALSNLSRKSAAKANEVFALHVMESFDNALQEIERSLDGEMLSDSEIVRFVTFGQEGGYSAYDVALRLKRMLEDYPLLESVYVVRSEDGTVVTDSAIMRFSEFGDSRFVESLKQSDAPFNWTGVREYAAAPHRQATVISLARIVYLPPGGFMVANVSVDKIRTFINGMSNAKVNYLRLLDGKGNLIAETGLGETPYSGRDDLSRFTSDYTGFEMRSGVKFIGALADISHFTYVSIALTFGMGIAWIVFVSRRNYRPMERILRRLDGAGAKGGSPETEKSPKDEFMMIESAIERMMEQSILLEKEAEESKAYKRHVLFIDFIEGKRPIPGEELASCFPGLAVSDSDMYAAVVVELDRYASFCRTYSPEDRHLFKFVVEKTLNEMFQNAGWLFWMDWTDDRRLAIVLRLTGHAAETVPPLQAVCKEAARWIESRLPFTVTTAIGPAAQGIRHVAHSYASALEFLSYKASLGNNRVIGEADVSGRSPEDMYRYVRLVRPFAQVYKIGEAEWQDECARFFAQLRTGLFTRGDLLSLMNYMLYYFHREMTELAGEFRNLWEREAMPKLAAMLDDAETVNEVESHFTGILTDLWQRMKLARERNHKHLLLKRIREYIENDYGNPDLSLAYLNDKFGVSGKYIGQLFKDEFGENFLEFLVRVRMENAKNMLREENVSVREIAERVGYTTPIAFIRAFKKQFGMTPGEYRRQAATQ